MPAFRSLRAALPDTHITLIGLPWAKQLLDYMPECLDEFIEFPGYPGLPERRLEPSSLPRFLSEIQERRFDLALQIQGNGSITNSLVAAFGAKRTGGYFVPGQFCPDPELFIPYPEKLPEIWRHLTLMRHLGATALDDRLHFHVPESDTRSLRLLLDRHDVEQPYVCLHPGAKAEWRCWPVEHFAAVGDALAAEGFQVIVTGSGAERGRAQHVVENMQSAAINLAGETSNLGVLGALIKSASLTISGDTGIAHLACAVDCPSVVIFLRSEVEGWPPLDRVRHRLVCNISGVTVHMVIQESLDLLQSLQISPAAGAASTTVHGTLHQVTA
ncbi:MAG: glycosyltransferase family 9 protein [Candidatus Methylacidiphilales bacterium]